jgi:hypothetical protein
MMDLIDPQSQTRDFTNVIPLILDASLWLAISITGS